MILHVLKPYRLFRRKVGIGAPQFWSKSCAKQQVILWRSKPWQEVVRFYVPGMQQRVTGMLPS